MKRLRILVASAAVLSLACSAAAHSGDFTFPWDSYVDPARRSDLFEEAPGHVVLPLVRTAAERFTILRNEDGRTLLPEGTVVDEVTLEDGRLEVFLTLPEVLDADGPFKTLFAETCSEILRYHFLTAAELIEIALWARQSPDEEYRALWDFTEEPGARPAWMARRNIEDYGNEPPPVPGPDYDTLYVDFWREWEEENRRRNIAGQAPLGTSGMPRGALAGRTIYVSGGHGWTWGTSTWGLQRPRLLSMNEDYGNADQLMFFVPYIFNAGATVVAHRPIGYQPAEVIVDNPAATYTGSWSQSSAARYFGPSGSFAQFANAAPTETATATYTPNIPSAGYYPVYCWANPGTNRISGQLYRVRHTGGEAQIRINHRRVGRGWVYLGTYYFNAGSSATNGSVVISNLAPPAGTTSGVVIADAIRFGNGVGDIARTGGVSGYTRREEANNYWVERSAGQGSDTTVYRGSSTSDNSNSINTPPRQSAHMWSNDGQGYYGDVYVGYHSNAASGTARGTVGLITTSGGTPLNQSVLASLLAQAINTDSTPEAANWEHSWNVRASTTFSSAYGEISANNLDPARSGSPVMNGTIIETAFHDNAQDAALLRDPKVRAVHGRAVYRGLVRYFNQYGGGPLVFLPEPPRRVRAVNQANGSVLVSWAAPPTGGSNGGAATSYVVYRSTDGFGFGNGVETASTSLAINGLTPGETVFFRVAAINAGGESMPSESIGVRVRGGGQAPVLVVNGYDRIDRFNNVPRFPGATAGTEIDQLIVARNNTYNYVREHGLAISNHNITWDSCSNEAVISSDVNLANYQAVVWILGEESSRDFTFDSTERTRVQTYLDGGGRLFVTGSEIGYELQGLDRATAFYQNYLKANYVADGANTYTAIGAASTILAGVTMTFSPGTTTYNVDWPDVVAAIGGSTVIANYSGGTGGGAAIAFSGGSPNRRVVNFGFPFETISSESVRNTVMQRVLDYFEITDELGALPTSRWMFY